MKAEREVRPPDGAAATVGVSVVVPCYDSADTIERALASVQAQTRPPAEVIVVDDHSPDDTLARLRAAAARFTRSHVRVIALGTNGGPSVARNAGWDVATQPYVAFLDADDSWHPRKLELQHAWMAARPELALTGHSRTFKPFSPVLPEEFGGRGVTMRALLVANCFPTASVMLRRALPFRFEPAKRHSEDYLLWLQIIAAGNAAWWSDLPLVRGYKAAFGEGGLSGDLWKMELGELDTYRRLARQERISSAALALLVPFSLAKHLGRMVRVGPRGWLARLPGRAR